MWVSLKLGHAPGHLIWNLMIPQWMEYDGMGYPLQEIKVKTGIKRSAKYVDKVKQLVWRDAAL